MVNLGTCKLGILVGVADRDLIDTLKWEAIKNLETGSR